MPQPAYLKMDNSWGLAAIAGKSGGGKSATTRLLLAQAAMNGVGLIIVDPHGDAGEESLLHSLPSLTNAFLAKPAISDEDIIKNVRLAVGIAEKRLHGDRDRSPVLLVIDEYTKVVLDTAHQDELIRAMLNFGTQYRKTGVKALIIGQNWAAAMSGNASIRRSIGVRIFHRLDADEVKLFTQHRFLIKNVPYLEQGQIFFDAAYQSTPRLLTVPYVLKRDLDEIKTLVKRPIFTDPNKYDLYPEVPVDNDLQYQGIDLSDEEFLQPELLVPPISNTSQSEEKSSGTDIIYSKNIPKDENNLPRKLGAKERKMNRRNESQADVKTEDKIRTMLSWGWSSNKIFSILGGQRGTMLRLINKIAEEER